MTQRTADEEARKRIIFDQLSPRRKKFIERIGYEKWDPFQQPKDPIEIRKDPSKRTTQQLIREFLQTQPGINYNTAYASGALDIAMGLVNRQDRSVGMYEFAVWYSELLKREGVIYGDD
jgi:hypothetical protein